MFVFTLTGLLLFCVCSLFVSELFDNLFVCCLSTLLFDLCFGGFEFGFDWFDLDLILV